MKQLGAMILVIQAAMFAGPGALTKVRVGGDANPVWSNLYNFSKNKVQRIALDPGEVPNHFSIEFPEAASASSIKVEWQFETSLTIADEGPHLDLESWLHHVSKWAELKPNPKGRFRLELPNGSGEMPFPKVSMASVRAEVAKFDPAWGKLIANTKSIREYPLSVGLSKVSIRISELQADQWAVTQTIIFLIPMGC